MKHIICDSGGHSSAIVAIEVVRRYGKENCILLNHNIHPRYEDADIKRFKREVAEYLGMEITYANYNGIVDESQLPSQFKVCMDAGALTEQKNMQALCTDRLKTVPFEEYLTLHFYPYPTLFEKVNECIIYYGFDKKEKRRIQRRSSILAAKGYKTGFPMLWEERTIHNTTEIGITPPNTYNVFKHANCFGCLKAGILHWYVVYVVKPEIYHEGIEMEEDLDFTIHTIERNKVKRHISLKELASVFERMKNDGVEATEHQSAIKFGMIQRKYEIEECEMGKPCECVT